MGEHSVISCGLKHNDPLTFVALLTPSAHPAWMIWALGNGRLLEQP